MLRPPDCQRCNGPLALDFETDDSGPLELVCLMCGYRPASRPRHPDFTDDRALMRQRYDQHRTESADPSRAAARAAIRRRERESMARGKPSHLNPNWPPVVPARSHGRGHPLSFTIPR